MVQNLWQKYFGNFPGLRTFAASMNSAASTTSVASMTLTASFHQKKLLMLMIGSSLASKYSKTVPFCGIDHQKLDFLLISDTLYVRGCWGQPMLLFWKLVDETQISNSPEATRRPSLENILVLLSLRAILFGPIQYDTPCMIVYPIK